MSVVMSTELPLAQGDLGHVVADPDGDIGGREITLLPEPPGDVIFSSGSSPARCFSQNASCCRTCSGPAAPAETYRLTTFPAPRYSYTSSPMAGEHSLNSSSESCHRALPSFSQRATSEPTMPWAWRKGTPLRDEVLGQGRGVEEPRVEPGGDLLRPKGRVSSDRRRDFERLGDRIGRGEHVDLVLLQVAVVAGGLALEDRQHGHQRAVDGAGLAPHQFQHIGIPLLRHHARRRAERVVDANEAEFARREDDPVLGQTRQMGPDQGAVEDELRAEVAVADGVDAVVDDVREAQLLGGGFPVDAPASSRRRRRPRAARRSAGPGSCPAGPRRAQAAARSSAGRPR